MNRAATQGEEDVLEFGRELIVGASRPLREVIDLSRKVAASRATVLILGETGTGKELFARGIHYSSPARSEPFVAVNCAAIPETLLESELFGHERGAFTDAREQKQGLVELAGAGTLFLDEVGELPLKLQPKLLRVLEDRQLRRVGGLKEIPVQCRIVAATNTSLEEAVESGEFREDLFYRLNVIKLTLPPLRARQDDVEALAEHFLERTASESGGRPKRLDASAAATLRAHSWPGNIRELKNVIERAAILADGAVIRPEHLLIQHRLSRSAASHLALPVAEIRIPPSGKSLEQIEEEAICLTLQLTRGNQSAASRILGISRPTLIRKMRKYGLNTKEG